MLLTYAGQKRYFRAPFFSSLSTSFGFWVLCHSFTSHTAYKCSLSHIQHTSNRFYLFFSFLSSVQVQAQVQVNGLIPLSFNSLLSHDDVWAYGISFSPYLMIKYCIFLMVCHHTRCTIFVLAARIDQSINQSILIFYSLHILGTFIV